MKKILSIFTITLLQSSMSLAQGIGDISIEPKNPSLNQPFKISISSNGDTPACGLQINLGDGTTRDIRAEKFPVVVDHTYAKEGNFAIAVNGKMIMRGLSSMFPCAGDAKTLAVGIGIQNTNTSSAQVLPSSQPATNSNPVAQLSNVLQGMQREIDKPNQPQVQPPQVQPPQVHQPQNSQKIDTNKEKIETLKDLSAILWMDRETFRFSERQFNFNVKYGAPPISANHKNLMSSEIPRIWKEFSDCSVKLGGSPFNEAAIKNHFLTTNHKEISESRQIYKMSISAGVETAPVRVPLKKDLNDAPNSEMSSAQVINSFIKGLGMKTNKNWCLDFKN